MSRADNAYLKIKIVTASAKEMAVVMRLSDASPDKVWGTIVGAAERLKIRPRAARAIMPLHYTDNRNDKRRKPRTPGVDPKMQQLLGNVEAKLTGETYAQLKHNLTQLPIQMGEEVAGALLTALEPTNG